MNRETTMEQLVDIELVPTSNNNSELSSPSKLVNSPSKLTNSSSSNMCCIRDIIETGISVSIHTFIMAVFERA